MNKQLKTTVILAGLVLLLCSLFPFSPLANKASKNNSSTELVLTAEEQLWLNQHPQVTVAFDGYFPPYSFLNEKGELVGIVVEQLKLISKKLNVNFKISDKTLWKDIYQAGINLEVDIVATMVDRKERHEYFHFTYPYVFKSMVIITHEDNNSIRARNDLTKKTVAIVSAYQYSNAVLEEFPNAIPFYVDNMNDAMLVVQTKQADAAILYLAAGLHIQKKLQLNQIKFAAYYDRKTANESIAVRKDWPLMQTILNKALASITEDEQTTIDEVWQTKLKVPVDYTLLIQLSVFSIILILILIVWLSQLRYRNAQIKLNQDKLFETNLKLSELKDSLEKKVEERTQSLSISELKYRHLIENLKDEYFFYRRNTQGHYTFVSSSIKNILGYEIEYFTEHGHTIFSDNIINKQAKKISKENRLNNNSYRFEIELFNRIGEKLQFKILETSRTNNEGLNLGVEGLAQDITKLNKTQTQLNWLSNYDDLTQLANRRMFLNKFELYLTDAKIANQSLALLFLDIDRFKLINDNIGHLAGDLVLTEAALRIKSALNDSDLAARIGGDEFTIILQDSNKKRAKIIAKKLIDYLGAPFFVMDNYYFLGSSIGISIYPQDGMDTTTLIKQADTAMYVAKRNRSGYAFCASDQLLINSRQLQIEQELRLALDKDNFSDEFELQAHYQAKVDLSSNKIIGYEALIRWKHDKLGSISPLEFIPIAEETGLISSLSLWMIKRVALQTLVWTKKGFEFGKIAINISAVELLNKNLATNIIELLDNLAVELHWIELEVTESALMKAPNVAVELLSQLKKNKILVAIDDFGTGYSSLAYLKSLPASYIKIDRSFIVNLLESTEDQEVVRAIIAMSHALGKKVIAEGVENSQQLEFLKSQDCDMAQGFWFSKPISALAVEQLNIQNNQ